MAHHNFDPNEMANLKSVFGDAERSVEDALPKFGATGRYPEGKLSDTDEGEIRFGVASYRGKVVIDFGKSVRSIGFTPAQAREIADTLVKRAEAAEQ